MAISAIRNPYRNLPVLKKAIISLSAVAIFILLQITFTSRKELKTTSQIVVKTIPKTNSARLEVTPNESPLYFIMHVGPMKTATSTMQCSLMNLESQKLLPDNIVLAESNYKDCRRMDLNGGKSIVRCIRKWKQRQKKMPKCWKKQVLPYIKKQQKLNRSIIVSQENLSWLTRIIKNKKNKPRDFLNQLNESLGERYQIVVIVTYRTFFDWVYSYFVQHNKVGSQDKRDFDHFPDEGGKKRTEIRPFAERSIGAHGVRNYFADKIIEFFSSVDYIDIKVLNLDDGDIMKQFLCDGLPPPLSHTMCNLKDKITLDTDMNAAPENLWANALAIKAHDNKLIQTNITRKSLIYQIMDYQKEKGVLSNDFPLKCPDEDFFVLLLQKTLDLYKNVFKDDTPQERREKERLYRENLKKKRDKFCEIDTDTMLMQDVWKSFFMRYSSNNAAL